MHPDLQELTNEIVENAKELLQKTKCKQAYVNYAEVREICNFLIRSQAATDKLVHICYDASVRIRNYEKIMNAVKSAVGENKWNSILQNYNLGEEMVTDDI